jgi:hypothetical protein
MARLSNMLLMAVLVVLAAILVSGAPPVTKKIVTATDAGKMKEIKMATHSKSSSQALEGEDAAPAEEAPAEEAPAEEAPAADGAAEGDAAAAPAAADGDADATSDDDDSSDEPDGIADDPEDQGKAGFWKNIIGGSSMTPGMENHHPSKDIPALVYALPIVGFIGVGVAIAAYCSFGT